MNMMLIANGTPITIEPESGQPDDRGQTYMPPGTIEKFAWARWLLGGVGKPKGFEFLREYTRLYKHSGLTDLLRSTAATGAISPAGCTVE
ncbi:hypothetical protein [Paraburkholderia tuberum]|uniref:hypothetical protein n=1 Tax=Paraburkholderia TaxID=1822464 RepID=UPI000B84B733|nr:hypothetical protein [Paraburkholderia tuberum]